MAQSKKLTEKQLDAFLRENRHGILSFQGKTPYALPMGYMYKRKSLLLGMFPRGRKMKYLKENSTVCYTICKPRWQTEGLKVPCTSVVIEGVLEEVTNRSYYGLKGTIPEGLKLYKIKAKQTGTWRCNRKPCELFVKKEDKVKK